VKIERLALLEELIKELADFHHNSILRIAGSDCFREAKRYHHEWAGKCYDLLTHPDVDRASIRLARSINPALPLKNEQQAEPKRLE